MKENVCLFAGTTEGRLLAERLAGTEVFTEVFTATEYGKEGLPEAENIRVCCGRLNEEQMLELFAGRDYALVIDATHPYAREVSRNLKSACEKTGLPLMRVLRKGGQSKGKGLQNGSVKEREAAGRSLTDKAVPNEVFVGSAGEAAAFLAGTSGKILVTTGSRELSYFQAIPGWEERIFARVLPLPEIVCECARAGFAGKHLIAMQGPFSRELNEAMLRSVDAAWMVTKDSGREGGFEEKRQAAARAGAGLVVIRRPGEDGISLEEAFRQLTERFSLPGEEVKRTVCLVGTGPGALELLTEEARQALSACDLIAGSRRVTEQLASFGKPVYAEYRPKELVTFFREHTEYTKICVACSGDTGFYSGAGKLFAELKDEPGMEIFILPGISTVNYFFARLGMAWEDARLLSMHGRKTDFVRRVRKYRKTFLLTGARDALKEICVMLLAAGLTDVTLTIGERLSLDDEAISRGTPGTLSEREIDSLTVVLIENENAAGCWQETESRKWLTHGLPDEWFLRDKVPMTKREVRVISLSKLLLTDGAVVYDVGAGTGSISVECARLSAGIRVYAIERKQEALNLLEKNRARFGLFNMEIVAGTAPEAMESLPAASHVFIGGSNGQLADIVRAVLSKNRTARFVVNLITLESMSIMWELVHTEAVTDVEIVQVAVAGVKKAGRNHLLSGQNPVFVISFSGAGAGKDVEI